ncbi:transmembrane protein, putative [Medicago truncatula]|uniref:Transmembrane protein, putative n=1 Tax=Medicago truncatula TaxID=3880 RepID=G7KWU3_MEDTR|nr:transmembrane protein, putative [Medicago truncatula]
MFKYHYYLLNANKIISRALKTYSGVFLATFKLIIFIFLPIKLRFVDKFYHI